MTEQILLQLAVILIAVQVFGYLCGRAGQPWVVGEILAGLALGPSALGAIWPSLDARLFPTGTLPTLQALGQLGLVLYMFSVGARIDRRVMLRQSRGALAVALSSVLLPLMLGAALGHALYPALAGPRASPLSFMLMMGTAMAITAFPVLARILTDRNMAGTALGTLGLTCAAIGDIVGWCLLAVVVAISQARGTGSPAATIGILAAFGLAMLLVVRPLLEWGVRRIRSVRTLVAIGLVLLLLSAGATSAIGVSPVFGAFLLGVVLPRNTVYADYMRSLEPVNLGLLLPLYFVYTGLRTHIGAIHGATHWLICLLALALACLGKLLGGALAARLIGRSPHEAISLGVLLNTRGLVELIVLNIGLDAGVLSPVLFAMLVIVTLVTTMMTSPLLTLLDHKR